MLVLERPGRRSSYNLGISTVSCAFFPAHFYCPICLHQKACRSPGRAYEEREDSHYDYGSQEPEEELPTDSRREASSSASVITVLPNASSSSSTTIPGHPFERHVGSTPTSSGNTLFNYFESAAAFSGRPGVSQPVSGARGLPAAVSTPAPSLLSGPLPPSSSSGVKLDGVWMMQGAKLLPLDPAVKKGRRNRISTSTDEDGSVSPFSRR
eukprot:GHVU01117067.1.p1 GENE.GHVU01117067.1~~GHVU01117067.1.p1  ORF type:complete len:210 (-),score=18.68 GHVU01117067.1:413-1042(-)